MELTVAIRIIAVAFIMSITGFFMSLFMIPNSLPDSLMFASLLLAALAGIIATVFSRNLRNSKQGKIVIAGAILFLLSFIVKAAGYPFVHEIMKVSVGLISILALFNYIYFKKYDFRNNIWLWFVPLILLGCLFKHMYWTGGNIIIFGSLLSIVIVSIVQLFNLEKFSLVIIMLLIWQLTVCMLIASFYFRYIKLDFISVGNIFLWMALIDILLKHERNTLQNSKYR